MTVHGLSFTCSKCGGPTTVIDSRKGVKHMHIGQTVRRRRKCTVCQYRFTTIEIKDELADRINAMLKLCEGRILALTKELGAFSEQIKKWIDPRDGDDTGGDRHQ